MSSNPHLSVVVPLYNEAENVVRLHQEITAALAALPHSAEIIFVDDGSRDDTLTHARTLSPLTLVTLRKNYGQTAAFDAGFKVASGNIIITLDGDLQNDPADIAKLLEKMETDNYDVVSGWRKHRKDTLSKKITSRTANLLRKLFFKDSIHDSGCALKAYRRECFDTLDLYGEMHRFIPALLEHRGYRIGEVVVNHRPRLHGSSKYGNVKRGLKSFTDMISVWFWGRYSARPLHIFGTAGLLLVCSGLALLGGLFIARVFFDLSLSERIWPLAAVLMTFTGIQLFTFGILADLQSKVYYRTHKSMNYHVRNIESL